MNEKLKPCPFCGGNAMFLTITNKSSQSSVGVMFKIKCMKKKRDDSVSLSLKVTRIMKITLILILVGVIQVSATTYAQEHRISVSVKNGTFYDVVSQIERQSEFMFFYKSEEIDGNQRINLNAKNKLVSEILDEITKNNNFRCSLQPP